MTPEGSGANKRCSGMMDRTRGNPCAVVDQKTGIIWLLATHNPGTANEKQITAKKVLAERTVWLLKSKDDGQTWTTPSNITASVKDPSWGWYATGPGIGIQIEYGRYKGRLIIPCDHSCKDTINQEVPPLREP